MNKAINESPFSKYKDMVLSSYSTAEWLRQFVLSMYCGSDYQVGLSQIGALDDRHYGVFMEMIEHYRKHGENDSAFMELGRAIFDLDEQKERERQRMQAIEHFAEDIQYYLMDNAKLKKMDAEDVIDMFQGTIAEQMDSGATVEVASGVVLNKYKEHQRSCSEE